MPLAASSARQFSSLSSSAASSGITATRGSVVSSLVAPRLVEVDLDLEEQDARGSPCPAPCHGVGPDSLNDSRMREHADAEHLHRDRGRDLDDEAERRELNSASKARWPDDAEVVEAEEQLEPRAELHRVAGDGEVALDADRAQSTCRGC